MDCNGFSFDPVIRDYSGEAAIPELQAWRACSAAALSSPFRHGLIGSPYPERTSGTAWDFHRSVKSAIVIRRRHVPPWGPENVRVLFCVRVDESTRCFSTTKELGTPPKAHVTPPDLSSPGPFVTARCRTTLAA
jgi:hypothetical protein